MREGEGGGVPLLDKAVILHHFLRVITDEYLSQNHDTKKQRGDLATTLCHVLLAPPSITNYTNLLGSIPGHTSYL